MKKYQWLGIIAAAAMAFDAEANLLTNPGFETGDLSSWSQWQPQNTAINNWGASGSSFSVGGWWQTSGWQDVTISNPNQAYLVGGWMFDDVAGNESLRNGEFASIRVEFKDAADIVIGTWSTGQLTGTSLLDDTWNDLTAQITPSSFGAGITKATLVWEVNNSGAGDGRGIFDNLIIEAVAIPEPAGFLLLSLAIVIVAIRGIQAKSKA